MINHATNNQYRSNYHVKNAPIKTPLMSITCDALLQSDFANLQYIHNN